MFQTTGLKFGDSLGRWKLATKFQLNIFKITQANPQKTQGQEV